MSEQRCWEEVEEGTELVLNEEMTRQRLVIWAAASGDFYPIHYDDGFARNNGLPGVIVHGALKGMLVGRLLDELTGDRGRVVRWKVSYRGMDEAGHELRVWGRVKKKYLEGDQGHLDLEVGVTGPDGRESTPGMATVVLPRSRAAEAPAT